MGDKKRLGAHYGHTGVGVGASETKGEKGSIVVDTPKPNSIRKAGIHEVRLRPRMEAIMGDAYHIAHAAIKQLMERIEQGEQFGEKEAKTFRALVASLVDLSREERMQLATFNPEEYDSDTIIEVLEMVKGRLPDDE